MVRGPGDRSPCGGFRGAGAGGGFTVAEALVALLLGCLLVTLSLGVLARQRTVQTSLTRRVQVLAAARTARFVLAREMRTQPPGPGGPVGRPDSLALRAYRGSGPVCPSTRDGDGSALVVRPGGVRGAEEVLDSVLVLSESAPPVVRALVGRFGGAPCPEDGRGGWERWVLSGAVPPGAVLVRYFQRASYHLYDGALRLRSREGGRQPLTPDVLDGGLSGFHQGAAGVEVLLVPRAERGEVSWRFRFPLRP